MKGVPSLDDLEQRWEREIQRTGGLPPTEEQQQTEAAQNQPGMRFEIDSASLTCTSPFLPIVCRVCIGFVRVVCRVSCRVVLRAYLFSWTLTMTIFASKMTTAVLRTGCSRASTPPTWAKWTDPALRMGWVGSRTTSSASNTWASGAPGIGTAGASLCRPMAMYSKVSGTAASSLARGGYHKPKAASTMVRHSPLSFGLRVRLRAALTLAVGCRWFLLGAAGQWKYNRPCGEGRYVLPDGTVYSVSQPLQYIGALYSCVHACSLLTLPLPALGLMIQGLWGRERDFADPFESEQPTSSTGWFAPHLHHTLPTTWPRSLRRCFEFTRHLTHCWSHSAGSPRSAIAGADGSEEMGAPEAEIGIGTIRYPNRAFYDGEWRNLRPHGTGAPPLFRAPVCVCVLISCCMGAAQAN